jgi:glycosyltransferase involved in cell wall biosynthesis
MTTVEPLVSIIIPTYNRAEVISATIDNVLRQTYRNIEVIVVDDGSTDNTSQRLASYGERIRVITQPNAGVAAARNRGIEAGRGDIFAFQDSDDQWHPTKLQRQVSVLTRVDESVPCCLCNTTLRVVNGQTYTSFENSSIYSQYGEGLWLNVMEVLATRFVLFNQAIVIRRWAMDKLGGFDENLKYLEDYELALRLAEEGPWAFVWDPLVNYCETSADSLTRNGRKDEIAVKERELKIFKQALERATKKEEKNSRIQKQLRRRLVVFCRGLRAAKLNRAPDLARQMLGTFLMNWERYRYAVLRRSPLFPSAVTLPIMERSIQKS